ncbi:MAG: hypothetical protein LBD40_01005 [Puniceicoccales bacterium]|jgi:hypothetical protein|nr:hypothetical protein [Puniceicoccales bacterium]
MIEAVRYILRYDVSWAFGAWECLAILKMRRRLEKCGVLSERGVSWRDGDVVLRLVLLPPFEPFGLARCAGCAQKLPGKFSPETSGRKGGSKGSKEEFEAEKRLLKNSSATVPEI